MPSMAEWVSSEVISAAVGLVFLLPAIIHYSTISFSCSFLPPKPPRNGKIVTQSHRHAAPRLMTNKWLTFYQMTISSCFDFTLQKKSQFCILSHHTLKTLSPFKSTLSDEWDQTAAASQAEGYTIIASMNRGCWHTRLHWSEWLGPCVHPTLWDLCCVSVLCLTFCQGSRYTRRLKDDVIKKESRVNRLDWRYSTIFVTLNKSHEKTTRNNEQACF